MTEDRVWQPWSQPRKFSPHPPAILSGCDNTLAMHLVCDKLAYNIVEGRPVGKLLIARNIRAGPALRAMPFMINRRKKSYFRYMRAPATASTRVGRQCVSVRKELIIVLTSAAACSRRSSGAAGS